MYHLSKILDTIEYHHTQLNMHLFAEHVTHTVWAFLTSIFELEP